jgi:uncharacterized protein (TIGR03382 family)
MCTSAGGGVYSPFPALKLAGQAVARRLRDVAALIL